MLNPPLDILNGEASIACVPAPVEVLGDNPQLDDQIVGEVLWLNLAALLSPQPNQHCLIATHDDPGIRAAEKSAPFQ